MSFVRRPEGLAALAAFGIAAIATMATAVAETDKGAGRLPADASSYAAAPATQAGFPTPGEPVRDRADAAAQAILFRQVLDSYRKGDVAAGDGAKAALAQPVAKTMAEWLALRFGGSAVGFERILAFMRGNADFPGAALIRRRAEEALLTERRPSATVRAFFTTQRPITPAGKLALAQAFTAEGLNEDATSLVQDSWQTDIFSKEMEAKFLDSFGTILTKEHHRYRMERALFKESFEAATRAAERAGKDYVALVKARIAVDREAKNAGALLEAVPPSLRADTSYLFSKAQHLRHTGKAEEAAQVVAAVTRDPQILADGDEWWVERRLIARKLLDGGDPKTAYAVVRAHGAESTEKRIEAEFHAGWIALRFLKEPALASSHFARAANIAGTPVSVARVNYWQGRAAEAAGREAEARGFYERAAQLSITYYGQLAAARLGNDRLPLRYGVDAGSTEYARLRTMPSGQAAQLLYEAGARDLALAFFADMGQRGSDARVLAMLGDVAAENRDSKAALALGKAAVQRGLPLDLHAFPTQGIPAFEPVGTKVEQAMVYAIARQESAFDPAAQSGAGARGLMQLMPDTARRTAKRYGVDFTLDRLLDPTYNARLGSAHLGELMEDWRGSYILAFASYNAGGGNVKKWIDTYGDPRSPGVDPVDWVERIPFSETRNYVQRVMENLQVYRRRLDERSALLIESDLRRGMR